MYNTNFELYFSDLTPEAQKELLNVAGLECPEDANWDCWPIATIEFDLGDKAKEIMRDYLDAEDVEDMLEQLRSLKTEGVVTENLYDFIIDNWDWILEEIKENKEE